MLDAKLLRTDLNFVAERLKLRNMVLDTSRLQELEDQRKQLQVETERLQAERNSGSKRIGQAKARGEDVALVMAEMNAIGDSLKAVQAQLEALQGEVQQEYLKIPNLPHESVPAGKGEDDNIELRRWGQPKEFSFTPKDHADLGEALGGIDFETAVKITGSRFSVLKGGLARMNRALIQFMLDMHGAEHGYQEVYVPYLVNAESLRGTGQLPKFEEDLFKLKGEKELYLIPTAEVPVTNIVRDQIVAAEDLPMKFVAHTPCFASTSLKKWKWCSWSSRMSLMPCWKN